MRRSASAPSALNPKIEWVRCGAAADIIDAARATTTTTTDRDMLLLSRHELGRRLAPASGAESADVFPRAWRRVLLRVRFLDRVAQFLAARPDGAGTHESLTDLNRAAWIVAQPLV